MKIRCTKVSHPPNPVTLQAGGCRDKAFQTQSTSDSGSRNSLGFEGCLANVIGDMRQKGQLLSLCLYLAAALRWSVSIELTNGEPTFINEVLKALPIARCDMIVASSTPLQSKLNLSHLSIAYLKMQNMFHRYW